MAEQGYFREQPHFQRKDALTTWSYIFIGAGAGVALFVLLLLWLMASDLLPSRDSALGLEQGTWVLIATSVLGACLVGLFFVIVARIGAAQAGGYLSADLDGPGGTAATETEEGTGPTPSGEATLATPGAEEAHPHEVVPSGRDAARIEDAFGPGGRMLLSYTFPEEQPRGIYGDTYVRVDDDAVLNVKTLLAKTLREPPINR